MLEIENAGMPGELLVRQHGRAESRSSIVAGRLNEEIIYKVLPRQHSIACTIERNTTGENKVAAGGAGKQMARDLEQRAFIVMLQSGRHILLKFRNRFEWFPKRNAVR